jgi:hypothetical protein
MTASLTLFASACQSALNFDPDLFKDLTPVCGAMTFDSVYTLPEVIEHDGAALEQSLTVDRGLDPVRTAVEQAQPKRAFQIGNRFR